LGATDLLVSRLSATVFGAHQFFNMNQIRGVIPGVTGVTEIAFVVGNGFAQGV
jgi:hypothetical protein